MNDPHPTSSFPFSRRGALVAAAFSFAGLPLRAAAGDEPAVAIDGRAFRRAVEAGDLEQVRRDLVRDPALAWSRDEKGRSVAVLALLAGHPQIFALFREFGLKPDLIETVMAGDWEAMRPMLEAAPEQVHLLHPFGGNAMHAAALIGHGERTFEVQTYGGDVNSNPPGGCGRTPLRLAFEGRDPRRVEATVANLLGNGADPNAPQKDGDSALHAAARAKNAYLVRMLLRKGADPAVRNAAGETPLALAEKAGDRDSVALLQKPEQVRRDHRASRFAASAQGRPYDPPALELPRLRINRLVGAAHRDLDTVRAEVARHPALAFAISSQDEMAVEAGAHVGRQDIVRFFIDHGVPQSLATSITAGDLKHARHLLKEDPRCIDERGAHDLPLTFFPSFVGGNVEAAQLLIENGVDVGAERFGTTALHVAARMGHAELVEIWLKHGADKNAKTRDEAAATPLDFARKAGHSRVVELLEKAT